MSGIGFSVKGAVRQIVMISLWGEPQKLDENKEVVSN